MNVGLAVVLSALMLVAAIPFALALTVTSDEEHNPGDQLTVSGTAGPNADITFKVSNPNGAQVAVGQTAADANGDYSVTLLRFPSRSTSTFPFGSYTVTATADEGTADLTVTFTEESAAPAAAAPDKGTGSPSTRLFKSSGIIGTATLTSRLLGLVRDQMLAYLFGAGNAMDAFNVATRIPNLMRDLFAEGAMSSAFVPTFTRRLTQWGKADAWRLGNQLLTALIAATGVIVVAGIIWTEPLARLLAGAYADVPGKLELTVLLTRILLPFLTLVAAAAALMGMLNSLNQFFTPALSPAMYNVGIIASAVLLVPIMPWFGGDPIVAIAIGALMGGVGQVAIQLPALYRAGFRYRIGLDPTDSGLRAVSYTHLTLPTSDLV